MSKEIATVRDVISHLSVLKLDSGETVDNALRLMEWRQRHAVGVTANGVFSGMFTRGDFIHNVVSKDWNPRQTLLGDVMTLDPITVGPECHLLDAFFILCRNNISHLPVLHNGNFLGIVSDDDLR